MRSLRNVDRGSGGRTLGLVLGSGLLGLFAGVLASAGDPPAPAGAAGVGGCGHDPNLDLADDSLEKAFVLMGVVQNPGVVPPFGGHDVRALRAIQQARAEVQLAIAYAESSCEE